MPGIGPHRARLHNTGTASSMPDFGHERIQYAAFDFVSQKMIPANDAKWADVRVSRNESARDIQRIAENNGRRPVRKSRKNARIRTKEGPHTTASIPSRINAFILRPNRSVSRLVLEADATNRGTIFATRQSRSQPRRSNRRRHLQP